MRDDKQWAEFSEWFDLFNPANLSTKSQMFEAWQAAITYQPKPAQLVSDKKYLRIFDEARHGSPNPVGIMRGIRACIAAYELAQPKPAPNPLLTTRDWQAQAQREASELLGTPEGAAKLVEAKRYGMLADALEAQQKPAPVLPEPKLQEIHNPQTGERQISDHGVAYYGTNWRVVRNLYTEEEVVAIFNKLTAVTK